MPRSDATRLGGMLVHHRVILGPYVARTHLYTWVKRDKVKLSSLSKETMGRARLEPSASRSVVQGVNRLVTHPSTSICKVEYYSISGYGCRQPLELSK